jgi:transcriptional regulator with XRE-family HTH domain
LGDHLRKRRIDLKLLQSQVALILGVEEVTIWNWENNRSSPQLHYIPRIIKFLGYTPFDNQDKTIGEKIVNARCLLGITQKELANRLSVDPGTLGRWERGKGQPKKRHLATLTACLICPPQNGKEALEQYADKGLTTKELRVTE